MVDQMDVCDKGLALPILLDSCKCTLMETASQKLECARKEKSQRCTYSSPTDAKYRDSDRREDRILLRDFAGGCMEVALD
jgi:hypothetical protein